MSICQRFYGCFFFKHVDNVLSGSLQFDQFLGPTFEPFLGSLAASRFQPRDQSFRMRHQRCQLHQHNINITSTLHQHYINGINITSMALKWTLFLSMNSSPMKQASRCGFISEEMIMDDLSCWRLVASCWDLDLGAPGSGQPVGDVGDVGDVGLSENVGLILPMK